MKQKPLSIFDTVAILKDVPEQKSGIWSSRDVLEQLTEDVFEVEFSDNYGKTICSEQSGFDAALTETGTKWANEMNYIMRLNMRSRVKKQLSGKLIIKNGNMIIRNLNKNHKNINEIYQQVR